MKITVVGTGYVGLVTGACLAEMGNQVVCLDSNPGHIAALQNGLLPIHEPGLLDLVLRNTRGGRLTFTDDVNRAVAHGSVQFIAVGTPADEDGSADLQHVLAAAQAIAERMQEPRLIVNKSTVPVGTADRVREVIARVLLARGLPELAFSVTSNPEFLKEGSAVQDFMRPDRVIVGADNEQAAQALRMLYAPFMRNRDRFILMDIRSAEFTKYASNAMLATRISFMNELALLAEKLGADIEQVRTGMGTDPRIGTHFLYAGTGYGGSCFPKDVKALVHAAQEAGQALHILHAVQAVNERQKQVLIDKIVARFGPDLCDRRFALWGLAFKPGTDDMREAPSLVIIEHLLARGAEVAAYDPVALAQARRVLGERPGLHLVSQATSALEGADALIIVTEWKEFHSPDFAHLAIALRQPIIFDGRNLFEPAAIKALGIEYHAIGRAPP
ncbi:UDP-glucose dehydrogenase family protein [Simplicispira metamorpha]|uniref:UDP-glucose 6-dehydrogenase n=1 Tax=Simplicispira metamorpha TaxID=80881 RepID=A0A4R2NAK7_9BURK|nr:UDP-glucose/GDP-mannose dehydrogenase family protein [Simplicispira metamorpha]TCP18005.1 UDPglucose 6-dehydrogenase [Simplicispira metamorpha]